MYLEILLKGLYVTFRNCMLTMTPVAVRSTAVSILLLTHVLALRKHEQPASAKNSEVTHKRLNVIDRYRVDSLLFNTVIWKNVDCLLASFISHCLSFTERFTLGTHRKRPSRSAATCQISNEQHPGCSYQKRISPPQSTRQEAYWLCRLCPLLERQWVFIRVNAEWLAIVYKLFVTSVV